jgi:hypothetical protein
MSNTALARPGTIASVFISAPAGAVSSTQALGTTAGQWRMKAKRARVSTTCRVEDTTGDNDSYPTAMADLMPRTVVALTGFMVADSALGLQHMASSTHNNGDYGIKIWFHSTSRFFQGRVVFRSITVDAGRDDPFVQVTIEAVVTNTNYAKLEAD